MSNEKQLLKSTYEVGACFIRDITPEEKALIDGVSDEHINKTIATFYDDHLRMQSAILALRVIGLHCGLDDSELIAYLVTTIMKCPSLGKAIKTEEVQHDA